ncbi:MAG: MurR/RpiR family transcriptional regulator, partial [Clostridia bacterium]|nr:MurR/RpiR family transcriptional regulator [Clostridia bacterium]
IDYETFKAISRDIVQARKVCAFAVGASTIATKAVQLSLLRLGVFVDASTDNHLQSIAAANLDGRDFLILFSVSGSTKDIVNLAEIAKKNGTKILVVTNYNKSPLAKYADYLLLSVRKEAAQNGGALSTSVAQEYIADVLCSAVFEVLENEGAVNRFKSSAAVADKAY